MIVDIHAHWLPGTDFIAAEPFWKNMFRREVQMRKVSESEAAASLLDHTGEKMVAAMDEAGIDVTVLLPLDWGLNRGEPPLSIADQNRAHAKLAEKYPGRVISFVGVDPRRVGSLDLFRTAVRDWGMRGLKLYPPCGFHPWESICHPFYEVAAEFKVPVLFHCASGYGRMYKWECSHPAEIARAARDFPEVIMIQAHAGGGTWWEDLMRVSATQPNLYADLSGWQSRVSDSMSFLRAVVRMREAMGIDRLLFGSDYPLLLGLLDNGGWAGAFKSLPKVAREQGIPFTQAEVDALLGGNAARILGLTPHGPSFQVGL